MWTLLYFFIVCISYVPLIGCTTCDAPNSEMGPEDCVCSAGYEGDANAFGVGCSACTRENYKDTASNSACKACGSGLVTPSPASITENDCACASPTTQEEVTDQLTGDLLSCECWPGYVWDENTLLCVPCGKNTYKPDYGNTQSCLSCSEWMTAGIAEEECHCRSHNSVYNNVTEYCECDVNYFGNALTGSLFACAYCHSHSVKDVVVNADECECGIGASRNPDSGDCELCGIGLYKDGEGDMSCTACGPGMKTESSGSTSYDDCVCGTPWLMLDHRNATESARCDCPVGYRWESSGWACIACGADTYMADEGLYESCTDCEPWMTSSSGASECECRAENSVITSSGDTDLCVCDAGYSGVPSTYPYDDCTPCALGWYKSSAGADLCTQCPLASTTLDVGSTDITDCVGVDTSQHISDQTYECDVGYYWSSENWLCEPCEANTYKDSVGNDAECTSCPVMSISDIGSTDISDCTCTLSNALLSSGSCQCDEGYEDSEVGCSEVGCSACGLE